MTCRIGGRAAVLALAGMLGAVSLASAQTIRGTATLRDPAVKLPAGAAFEALLEDVSQPGASVLVVGFVRVDPAGTPPIAFQISYDSTRIRPDRKYAVRGRIMSGDTLLFVSETSAPAPGTGAISLTLRRVGSAPPKKGKGGGPAGKSWRPRN